MVPCTRDEEACEDRATIQEVGNRVEDLRETEGIILLTRNDILLLLQEDVCIWRTSTAVYQKRVLVVNSKGH